MTQPSFDRVHLAAHGKVAVITLDHPPTINALSSTLVGGLNAALDAVLAGGFRALVLTGDRARLLFGRRHERAAGLAR